MNEVSNRAAKILNTLRAFSIQNKYFYFDPLINITEEEIVFEWWLSNKKLSLYIDLVAIEYFKNWGVSYTREGQVESPEKLKELWEWLIKDATKRFDLPVANKE